MFVTCSSSFESVVPKRRPNNATQEASRTRSSDLTHALMLILYTLHTILLEQVTPSTFLSLDTVCHSHLKKLVDSAWSRARLSKHR